MISALWTREAADAEDGPAAAAAGRKNMLLLLQLRWIAVTGQLTTIIVVHSLMGIRLPLGSLLVAPAALIVLNLASLPYVRRRAVVKNGELFMALLCDVAALTWQLHQTGGITNPFAPLFLLQVVIGAMLLTPWSSWLLVGVSAFCLLWLAIDYRPLDLPTGYEDSLFDLYLWGSFICFALIAVLLVQLVARIARNLRDRDAALADIRQQAAEETHIVRMGLLASGAAHELGTPLSSLSVILGDWQRMPRLASDPDLAQDIADMQAEVLRCKTIVSNILVSAGEARGVAPAVTTVRRFLEDIVAEWRSSRLAGTIRFEDRFGEDMAIVSDPVLKQVIDNVIDNAAEVSPNWIGITATRAADQLVIEVRDAGPGFAPEMLEKFGQPYQSSKGRPGGGLGLFLLVNVLRKLGGKAEARNPEGGGAAVTLMLPLAAVAYAKDGR
ncbi:two-component system, sensor histidine kinase RegB [Sphingomonas laterariae]|uniref:histidine kinase n=1 Tax=Edaphosphingomonas laterariae TaxID=861865 RepID=A0A239CD55_9SPHN|nr:ATP-binding protein [Sphingomonas laterariae]SNS17909.1 two-component system, sensor histidine kinase RegB [Sphingomonas laterariae]